MKLLIHNFEDELKQLAKSALEIKVLIAFLTESGLNWLPGDKFSLAEFIVGIDLGITSPEAIKRLQQQGACVRIFSEPGKMFHPKAIYLRTEENGEYLIVGSNNLTSGGISSNHELSILSCRNSWNDGVFSDFLAYFESLKSHHCCGVPGEQFFQHYKPADTCQHLTEYLHKQKRVPLLPPPVDPITGNDRIETLGEFIRLLAKDFPNLLRRRGQKIKEHPLKRKNEKEFNPLFKNIVTKVSQGRLHGYSQLNIGGNWYQIPNIFASNASQEPWENVGGRGRLVLQIHFTEDFTEVFFSIVILYNLHRSIDSKEMPDQVAQRFKKLLEHLEYSSTQAKMDGPVFRHWNYKNDVLWSKPVMTFAYPLDSLPDDKILYADLCCLSNLLIGALVIT
jgi:hypothetical protein